MNISISPTEKPTHKISYAFNQIHYNISIANNIHSILFMLWFFSHRIQITEFWIRNSAYSVLRTYHHLGSQANLLEHEIQNDSFPLAEKKKKKKSTGLRQCQAWIVLILWANFVHRNDKFGKSRPIISTISALVTATTETTSMSIVS